MRIVASERVMSMLHSVSSVVRIVAFRVVLGVSSADLAQTDGDLRVLSRIQAMTPSDVFLEPWRMWAKMTISILMSHERR